MPAQDRTGPLGQGPLTGRGFGPCGRGLAFRHGFGRGFGFRQAFVYPQITEAKEKQLLKQELEAVKAEQAEIEKGLKELK